MIKLYTSPTPNGRKISILLEELNAEYETILIDLGKKLDLISESECIEENKIHACNSQTWVKINFKKDLVLIKANSESSVVKGLLKILQIAFNNSEKNSIINFIDSFDDCNSLFEWLNIGPSISSQRQNGFIGSLEHIKRELTNA